MRGRSVAVGTSLPRLFLGHLPGGQCAAAVGSHEAWEHNFLTPTEAKLAAVETICTYCAVDALEARIAK